MIFSVSPALAKILLMKNENFSTNKKRGNIEHVSVTDMKNSDIE